MYGMNSFASLIGIFYCMKRNKSIRNIEKVTGNFRVGIVEIGKSGSSEFLRIPSVDIELY